MALHQLSGSTGWPLPARIRGVLRHPRATFVAITTAPRSLDVLTVACAAAFAAVALVLETETGELALLDRLERTVSAFGGHVDEPRYAALQDISRRGAAYALVNTVVSVPLLAMGFAAAAVAWGHTWGQREGVTPTYRQVLAIASHASIILALRQVITAPVIYVRETMTSPLTLNMFLTVMDEGSPLARFAGMIDFFVIWWIVVLAIGMSVLYRRSVARLAAVFSGAYVLLVALVALMMAITGGAA